MSKKKVKHIMTREEIINQINFWESKEGYFEDIVKKYKDKLDELDKKKIQ